MAIEAPKCPKDGNPLTLLYESERFTNGFARVTMYYKCPVCNHRRDVERLEITRENDRINVRRSILSQI